VKISASIGRTHAAPMSVHGPSRGMELAAFLVSAKEVKGNNDANNDDDDNNSS